MSALRTEATETFEWHAAPGKLELEDGTVVFVALGDVLEGYDTPHGPIFTALIPQTEH